MDPISCEIEKDPSPFVTSGTAKVVGGNALDVWWRVVSSATATLTSTQITVPKPKSTATGEEEAATATLLPAITALGEPRTITTRSFTRPGVSEILIMQFRIAKQYE